VERNAVPADDAYADALLAAALEYAADGLYVFPAWVTRGEGDKKVVQPIAQWRKAATKDAATIKSRWGPGGPWRGAHVCIDTGGSGLVALDGDGDWPKSACRSVTRSPRPGAASTGTTPKITGG
jgi:hypothetical protein